MAYWKGLATLCAAALISAGPCLAQGAEQPWYLLSLRCRLTSQIQMAPLGHTVDGNPEPAYVIAHLPGLAREHFTLYERDGIAVAIPGPDVPKVDLDTLLFVQGREDCLDLLNRLNATGGDPARVNAFVREIAAAHGFPMPPVYVPDPHILTREYLHEIPEVPVGSHPDPCAWYGVPPPALDKKFHDMGCYARQP